MKLKPWNNTLTLKVFCSIVLMSLVDSEYWFIWASVRAPVNTHYSSLLQSTDVCKIIDGGEMIPNLVQKLEDIEIQSLIFGEGAFRLWTFMLKPHGGAILPDDKQYFNYRNSRARLVREGALGRLKIKFRVFSRKCESNKETLNLYGLACVALHHGFLQDWLLGH